MVAILNRIKITAWQNYKIIKHIVYFIIVILLINYILIARFCGNQKVSVKVYKSTANVLMLCTKYVSCKTGFRQDCEFHVPY